ncbi:MAG: VacB/RNase II family 3'-5' exoribonuclease, partial [Bacilli bacterium]
VHIADVSYYAKENSEIDKEAYDRGTSVYLVDRVVPMLPHQLSNGICSLNPGVERLTITCEMEINDVGKVVDYKIYESFIKSRIQMTYKKVNQIYNNEDVVEYKPYINSLMLMKELSIILGKNKDERGYLDFDVDEAKILVDELGHPLDIVKRDRGIGEKVIEDFMIVANETVATTIFYMELPFIYRIHEYPKEEKIREFLSFLGTMGYHMPGNLKDTNPKSIQGLLKFLNDKPEFKILSSLLLRNMRKAIYGTANLGHYGLASKCYTHFTSPIRRYPDTTVHRLLRTYLFNKDLSHTTIAHWEEKLPLLAEHASAKERASIECEREVEDMKMAEYMENHIGEEFKGMICSVMNFGLFVQLDNLIEGLVHVNEMNDFFVYDENTMSLTGRRTNIVYKIGDEIIVRVLKASKIEKTIDFVIVKKV